MARPLRIEFPGAIYHLTSRGDRREPIFEDDEDRNLFLSLVGHAMSRYDAAVLAYCLMDNHYHLVVQTRQGNLSRLMQRLNGAYTQAYNRRHNKVGHLFQGRYKAILVDQDTYLLEVCRYVELNPVRARLIRNPANWRWSSYRAHAGMAAAVPWLDTAGVHGHVLGRDANSANDRRKAALQYAALVAAGKGVNLWEEALSQQIFLGERSFVERMHARLGTDAMQSKDIPREQRRRASPSIDQYLEHRLGRDHGIHRAVMEGQHSLTAVAAHVGLSVSRVSRIVTQLEKDAKDKA